MKRTPLTRLRMHLRPGKSTLARNIWNLYVEIAYFGFLFGIINTFLSVYAIRLGASNSDIGLLTALPALVFMLWSIPAARGVEQAPERMKFLLATGTLHRFGILALGLMPFVLTSFRAEAVVVIVTLLSIPQVMANIAFSAIFADVVPTMHRARVVAVRNTLLGLTSTLASFLGGLYLGLLPADSPWGWFATFPHNYQVLFLLGFIASMIGMAYLSRIRSNDPMVPHSSTAILDSRLIMQRTSEYFALILRQREFVRFTLALFILHWGLFLPAPLYSLYWVRGLHASDAFIGLLLTVQSITSMLVYPLLPRIVRRLGNRTLLALSALLIALYPLLTAMIFTLEPLLVVSVVGGVGGAMFGLGSFNLLLEVTPQMHRPSFIATYNAAVNSAGFVAPFVGTALLNVIDINADLLLGGVFRLIGLLAVVLMVGISGEREVARV